MENSSEKLHRFIQDFTDLDKITNVKKDEFIKLAILSVLEFFQTINQIEVTMGQINQQLLAISQNSEELLGILENKE